jgi:heme/copper-type cytochrome/quinol oxidase subunit 2
VKTSDEAMLLTVVVVIVVVAIFVMGFGSGVAYGREECKNELHKQVEENNRLLKENIALREAKEQSK